MREIKFRAWDNDEKAMLSGDEIEESVIIDGEEDEYPKYYTGLSYGKLFVGYYKENGRGDWAECEVMQFTGIHDKNGKEIYEGDIVKNGLAGTFVVKPLERGSFSLLGICLKERDHNYLIWALNSECEVVGNIHENPELLEVAP